MKTKPNMRFVIASTQFGFEYEYEWIVTEGPRPRARAFSMSRVGINDRVYGAMCMPTLPDTYMYSVDGLGSTRD